MRFSHKYYENIRKHVVSQCCVSGRHELLLGMSFGVRLRVRTFGNKHPDGSNVRIFFFFFFFFFFYRIRSYLSYVHLCMNIYIHKCMFVECSLESTFIIKSY